MPEDRDVAATRTATPTADRTAAPTADLAARVRAAAIGLEPLISQARAVQERRARTRGAPRWTDVFTTQFTEFSNRPR